MSTALITGASNGIGLELARIHASKGDNLILVARNLTKLIGLKFELESKFKISILVLEKDLSKTNSANEVFKETSEKGIQIDYLINNAGFGDFGMFADSGLDKQLQMINLNIIALTSLTRLYLTEMIKRRSGKIMNVASTAAFQPGPTMAVYYATKAYVLHFSEAIANELQGSGVTVTALCPGATESGFQAAANMYESKLVKGKKLPSSKEVALYGYKSMMNNKTVAIHGFMNYLLANSVRFAPRSVIVKVTRAIQNK